MSTLAQRNQYADHKAICQALGIPQSTLSHKILAGSVSVPSSTGVTVYTGPGAKTTGRDTQDTSVWAVYQPQIPRQEQGDLASGRRSLQRMIGQFPAIDDAGHTVVVSHDDWLTDPAGAKYRIANPTEQPDQGFWYFELIRQK